MQGDEPAQPVKQPQDALVIHEDIKVTAALFLGDENMKQAIVNLTQHKATPEQTAVGVMDMEEDWRTRVLVPLLTFDEIPDAGT